jgi:hypothetical protein
MTMSAPLSTGAIVATNHRDGAPHAVAVGMVGRPAIGPPGVPRVLATKDAAVPMSVVEAPRRASVVVPLVMTVAVPLVMSVGVARRASVVVPRGMSVVHVPVPGSTRTSSGPTGARPS